MIVCAVLPLIALKVSHTAVTQEPIVKMESIFLVPKSTNAAINLNHYLLVEPVITTSESNESAGKVSVSSPPASFPVAKTITILYGTGFFMTLISLFISIYKMVRIIYHGIKIKKEKYTIVCVSKQICPFSWSRYIVLSENDYRKNPDEIFTHESIHIRKRHSLDLLFAELFILFHWFNPVVWLLKGELQDVHEYEADRGVINQGADATKYQLMLLKKAVGARSYAIANSFNHNKIKIKNRITMMLKGKSTQWARLKLLLFAPLAVVLLQAFARPETVRIQESLISSEGTTVFEKLKQSEEKQDSQEQEKTLGRKNSQLVVRKDTASVQHDRLNKESYNKIEEIAIKDDSDTTKKVTIKLSAVVFDNENNDTLKGDSSSSFQITLDRNFTYDPKQIEEIAKQNGEILKLFDKDFLSASDSLDFKLKLNMDNFNLNFDSLKKLGIPIDSKDWEEFKTQIEDLHKYFYSEGYRESMKKLNDIGKYFNSDKFDSIAKQSLEDLKKIKIDQKQLEEIQRQLTDSLNKK